ncbi:hypothetical protein M3D15_06960 [Pseudoclavibacter alba]|uniref:Uncharacterized protein n=1 Tax=Pseudoclavibacter albus TaxID=272241 RepID=A0ABT2HXM4_9MICO|nr:hypothetical protein [Pseudoclavibacter alba]MCT2043070.1 hypothetical protein [Pseudoclavibacter alba]
MLLIVLAVGVVFTFVMSVCCALSVAMRGDSAPGRPMFIAPTLLVVLLVIVWAFPRLVGATAPVAHEARYEVKQVIADSVAQGTALRNNEAIRYRVLVQETDGTLRTYEANKDKLTMTTISDGETAELIVQELDPCASLETCVLLFPGTSERFELRVAAEDIEYKIEPLPEN